MKKIIIVIVAFAIGFFGYKYVFNNFIKDKSEEIETVVNSNKSSSNYTNEEWTNLFDGVSFNGWHIYLKDSIPSEWTIKNKTLIFTPNPDKQQGLLNLVTDKKYTNFVLSLDWKISKEGNSGVFWGINEDPKYVVPYMTAPEVQILDDESQPTDKSTNQLSGAIFGLFERNENAIKKQGEWNNFKIKIDHNSNEGKVWLNDVLTTQFPLHGPKWDSIIKQTKFKDWKGFAKLKSGKIGLQDHGNPVEFRNIRIKEL